MVGIPTLAVAATALLSAVSAHPGHSPKQEAAERRAVVQDLSIRSVSHCADKLKARGLVSKSLARREALAHGFRKRDGLEHKRMVTARDLNTTLATNHEQDPSLLFASNGSCTLAPDVTQGPYYVAGEYIRNDMREDQTGVSVFLDVEVLDVETCEPLANKYVDFWHCNSTGVYGGVVANGNGNINDTSNLDATYLRGVAATNDDGIVQMATIFPGHYIGRTNHIHVLIHSDEITANDNGTLSGSNAMHVGQFYFDQTLIDTVETTYPYSTNTQEVTTNEEDVIIGEGSEGDDPIMDVVMLGTNVTDGLLAWIAVGVNTSALHYYDVSPAATLTEEGGVTNPNVSIIPFGDMTAGFPGGTGTPLPSSA